MKKKEVKEKLVDTPNIKMQEWKILAEKRRINEMCMERWLLLEFGKVSLASYFLERGITEICVYGFGVLGKLAIRALENSGVKIICIIDKKAERDSTGFRFCKNADGWQGDYILVSVMSDIRNIVVELKKMGCRHILSLEHILEVLLEEYGGNSGRRIRKYPEITKFRQLDKMDSLQVVNFGTGLGFYDFCYEGMQIKAFNFSLLQQSLEFDYKLMKYYQNKFLPGCVTCFVLPYFIFMANHILEVDEINERYYMLLPAEEVEGSCNTSYSAYMQRNREGKYFALEGDFDALEQKRPTCEKDREKQIQKLLDHWKRELGIVSFDSGIEFPGCRYEIERSVKWFKKILRFCQEHCLKPVVVIPPMSQDLLDKISKEFRQMFFYDVLKDILDNWDERIPVLDYTADETFCNPSFYGTPCFLVKEKACFFTKDVLRKIGIL